MLTSGIEIPDCTQGLGMNIGECAYGGERLPVIISDSIRSYHARIIGGTGRGKTALLEHMVSYDVSKGNGVMVIDPDSAMLKNLMNSMPAEERSRIVYINPGNPDYTLLWNPLSMEPKEDVSRAVDGILMAVKSFIDHGGWGDRLEYLLRCELLSLSKISQKNIADVSFIDLLSLLRPQPKYKKKSKPMDNNLYKTILDVEDDPALRHFWLNEYPIYRNDEFSPPRHKLGKLLQGKLSLTFSQPKNTISFDSFLKEGKIVLLDLSSVGSMLQSFIGSFMVSQLYTATLKRSAIKEKDRKPFFVYMDEAFRYMPADFEDALVISRKYNVGLNIFQQFTSQFDRVKNEALAGVGTNIIFQVGINDARILSPILQTKFTPEDIVDLKLYECIARIGSDVVKFNTNSPLRAVDTSVSEKIIQESYKRYYKPVDEVKASLLRRQTNIFFGDNHDLSKMNVKEFVYDAF